MGRMITLGLPMWNIFWFTMGHIHQVRIEVWKDMKEVLQARRAAIAKGDDVDDCLSAMIRENMSDKDMLDHMVGPSASPACLKLPPMCS